MVCFGRGGSILLSFCFVLSTGVLLYRRDAGRWFNPRVFTLFFYATCFSPATFFFSSAGLVAAITVATSAAVAVAVIVVVAVAVAGAAAAVVAAAAAGAAAAAVAAGVAAAAVAAGAVVAIGDQLISTYRVLFRGLPRHAQQWRSACVDTLVTSGHISPAPQLFHLIPYSRARSRASFKRHARASRIRCTQCTTLHILHVRFIYQQYQTTAPSGFTIFLHEDEHDLAQVSQPKASWGWARSCVCVCLRKEKLSPRIFATV